MKQKEDLISRSDYEARKKNDEIKKEKMSGYFLSMSNTLLGSFVIGIILLVFGARFCSLDWKFVLVAFIVAIALVIASALIGYRILNKKK